MQKMICFGFMLLFLAGCKKDEINFTLKGVVSDATFGGGLEGATVSLTEVPIGTGVKTVLATTVVGANGSYSFTFKRGKAEKYIIQVSKSNYFTIENDIKFSEFSTESALEKNYSTTAKSWVKLRFVNIAPNDVNDQLVFHKQAGKVGCIECCSSEDHILNGIVDTAFTCITDGNTSYSYFYQVTGTTNQGIESVVSVPFDTVTIIKNY